MGRRQGAGRISLTYQPCQECIRWLATHACSDFGDAAPPVRGGVVPFTLTVGKL